MSLRVTRTAQATWQGDVAQGDGRLGLGSGAFEGAYSLKARIEGDEQATNPEELLGAAQAGCFTMSLAGALAEAGHPAREIHTTAAVTLGQVGERFDITRIELRTIGDVPGLDRARFQELATQAKDCTISRALTGTEITLHASLSDDSSPR